MKNNYIYVPGLSESVADEVKKEKDAEAPRFITGTGAVKKEAVTHDRGILRTRKVDDRQLWQKKDEIIKAGFCEQANRSVLTVSMNISMRIATVSVIPYIVGNS